MTTENYEPSILNSYPLGGRMIGFAIILTSLLAGQCMVSIAGLPIPGSICGLIILLIWMCIDESQLPHVKAVGDFLLRHIAVFIIPPGVAILGSFASIKQDAILLLFGLIISTVISFLVCIQIARLAQLSAPKPVHH
jgi:holin-like protein